MGSERVRGRLFVGGAAVTLALLTGCPDPDAKFADFVQRHGDIYGMGTGGQVGVGGGCAVPLAGELDGQYLFSLVAKQSPGKPAPLRATLTTSAGTSGLQFALELSPLSADDRVTAVGAPFGLGPFDVGSDGTFEADWGTITVPRETNPISDSELTAEVQLLGTLCPGAYFCGVANGTILMPVMLSIDGSSWTMESLDTFTEPPKVNCAGDLADPL